MAPQSVTQVYFVDIRESERFEAAAKAYLIVKEQQSKSDDDDDDDDMPDPPRVIAAYQAKRDKDMYYRPGSDVPIVADDADFVQCVGASWENSDDLWHEISSHCFPGQAPCVQAFLRPGYKLQDTVAISGLISSPQYNGCIGKVIDVSAEDGRVGVEIISNDARRRLSVRLCHLTRVSAQFASAAGIDDGPFRLFEFTALDPRDEPYIHEAIVVRESVDAFLESCAMVRASDNGNAEPNVADFKKLLAVARRCEAAGKVMIVQHVVC